MKTQQKTTNTISRPFLLRMAATITSGRISQKVILQELKELITLAAWLNRSAYEAAARKLFAFFSMPASQMSVKALPQKIFSDGNGKLNFLNWSTLPGVNCPGAGACFQWIKKAAGTFQGWCYTFASWRNAYAFTRQLLNTILERGPVYRLLIIESLKQQLQRKLYRNQEAVPFRLYVDGDFPNLEILKFWMDTLKQFPRLKAYGYSKSLHLFKELDQSGYIWPENYALNISSGGMYYQSDTAQYVRNMAIYRGDFIAVDVDKKTLENWNAQKLTTEDRRAIRSKVNARKVFICPKYCGDCTLIKENPHACGNKEKFKNISIVLPVH